MAFFKRHLGLSVEAVAVVSALLVLGLEAPTSAAPDYLVVLDDQRPSRVRDGHQRNQLQGPDRDKRRYRRHARVRVQGRLGERDLGSGLPALIRSRHQHPQSPSRQSGTRQLAAEAPDGARLRTRKPSQGFMTTWKHPSFGARARRGKD
jgi:hypothetical protein